MPPADAPKSISLNGATFTYDVAGESRDETIVVLHGGRGIGDHRTDFNAFRPLADSYRLLAYDQRGCGTSSLTPPFTFEQFAGDLEAIRLSLCGGKPMVLIGGSFGGMIAMTYAVKYGSAGLSRLILRGTAPSHHHEAEAIANFKARLHKAPNASLRMVEKMFSDVIDDTELRLIRLALQPLYFETFDPDAALERTRTLHLHAETHNALFATKDYDLRDRLADIAVPTLVIVGGADWICPPSQSRLMAQAIPGAELLEIPGANHAVHVEANATVLAGIRDFLARTGP